MRYVTRNSQVDGLYTSGIPLEYLGVGDSTCVLQPTRGDTSVMRYVMRYARTAGWRCNYEAGRDAHGRRCVTVTRVR